MAKLTTSLTIWHNPRCSKSRETLALIENAGHDVTVVNYLETPPTPTQLKKLLDQLGLTPEAITRTKEPRYAELGLKEKPPKTVQEWVTVLSENPVLIERPIVTNGKKAVLGRPPENVRALL